MDYIAQSFVWAAIQQPMLNRSGRKVQLQKVWFDFLQPISGFTRTCAGLHGHPFWHLIHQNRNGTTKICGTNVGTKSLPHREDSELEEFGSAVFRHLSLILINPHGLSQYARVSPDESDAVLVKLAKAKGSAS